MKPLRHKRMQLARIREPHSASARLPPMRAVSTPACRTSLCVSRFRAATPLLLGVKPLRRTCCPRCAIDSIAHSGLVCRSRKCLRELRTRSRYRNPTGRGRRHPGGLGSGVESADPGRAGSGCRSTTWVSLHGVVQQAIRLQPNRAGGGAPSKPPDRFQLNRAGGPLSIRPTTPNSWGRSWPTRSLRKCRQLRATVSRWEPAALDARSHL